MLWRATLGIGRGIANARARSVAAPIANRELQKLTGGGRKCSQLFSVEREGGVHSVRYRPNSSNPKLIAHSTDFSVHEVYLNHIFR